ncbi:MAG TPA: DUF2332 domain-containing protein [Acidimicrobiia bacterium]|nr:DUF2332 domain-containing protein [Acidimicrobiia bacterium]
MTDRDRIREAFIHQIGWCESLGSPLYRDLLTVALDDLDAGGAVADVVEAFPVDPMGAALALRLMGGVHRLVLMGLAPELAIHYPSVGGSPDAATVGADFLAVIGAHNGYLRDALSVAPQTNEIGRCAVLLPGLMYALDREQREVRLFDIGASGGLNLLLDRYRYEMGSWTWGNPTSPAVITSEWSGPAPATREFSIVERRGCDLSPIDVTRDEQRLRLLSFIWADQTDRFARTAAALGLAADDPPHIDQTSAESWLDHHLRIEPPPGVMTIVQHSVMWQYLPPDMQGSVASVIEEAGARATRRRPLAHVSFEPPPSGYTGDGPILSVTRWPGGETRVLASAHAHGAWVRWDT